jgi:acyl-coenzyme A thioesterase PaaI-like protein
VTVIAIHNADWGFETNCFVCEPRNERGLRIPFFHDTDRGVVFAEVQLDGAFSGAPNAVHGGITLAVLDEAMAWACIAVGGRWAVTTETTTRFHRAVYVDRPYRVEATVLDRDDATMRCAATITDARGTVRAEAAATFTTLGEAHAVRLGAVVDDATRRFTGG